jgi:hypothetical protein
MVHGAGLATLLGCGSIRSIYSRSSVGGGSSWPQREAAVSRGLAFLEQAEVRLARSDPAALDCDWMLGAAVTCDAYRTSSPPLAACAARMAARLHDGCVGRWGGPTRGPARVAAPATPAALRRAVLDSFAASRVALVSAEGKIHRIDPNFWAKSTSLVGISSQTAGPP